MTINMAMMMSDTLANSLVCLNAHKYDDSACPHNYDFLAWFQNIYIILTLAFIFLSALCLFKNRLIAYLSAGFALLSGELHYYANQFL
ncbi:MAG: hypothetical protein MI673_09850, partial [Thiotrichales bacterium]|nr:hypothetical protein [Thiotrichales bacterium]